MKTKPRQLVAEALSSKRELRSLPATSFALRKADDGSLTLTGHASVFDVAYDVWGGPPYGWSETMDAGAFDKTLRERPDVQLLINHGGMPLARTKSGTLRLSTDSIGLATEADLEPRSATVQELALAMERGDIDEMSFAFRVIRQEWDEEYTERRILEVSIQRGDVSVVNYGANPATSATLRALALADVAGMSPDQVLAELRGVKGVDLSSLSAARDVLGQAVDGRSASKRAADADTDPDEDPGALAQAVDAILDEVQEALAAGEIASAIALVTGAEATIDALLELLGVPDDDDIPNGPPAAEDDAARSVKPPAAPGLSLAEARALMEAPEALAS